MISYPHASPYIRSVKDQIVRVDPKLWTGATNTMGITVEFYDDGCALLTMRNGQNRLNLTTLKQFNDALDEVERFTLSIFSC